MKKLIILFPFLCLSARAQWTPYMQQLLQKPNAASAKAWLQIDTLVAGTNVFLTHTPTGQTIISASGGGGGGSGTVTSVSVGNASPLFTSSVANPTTTPTVTFTLNYTPAPNTPILTNQVYATNIVSGGQISPSVAGGLTNADDVAAIPNPGDILIWSGSMWTNGPQVGVTAGVASVTNAGIGQTSIITSSNAPVPSFKSITAGANTTVTDNGTNLTISSSGGGSGIGDLLAIQTNNYVAWDNVNPDGNDGSAVAFQGISALLSFASSGGTGAALLQHNLPVVGQGIYAEARTAASANAIEFCATATDNNIYPYTNGSYAYQTYVVIRSTSSVRQMEGFVAGSIATALSVDTIASTNMVAFRFSTSASDTTWKFVTSDGTGVNVADTGVTVTADSGYYLSFVKSGNSVTYAVNHAAGSSTSSHVPNIFTKTTDAMAPFNGVTTLANVVKTNLIQYIGYSFGWANK